MPDQECDLRPRRSQAVGTIDERFQAYNVEMMKVTGGSFWKPYSSISAGAGSSNGQPANDRAESTPSGMDPGLYEYRPPLDLSNRRLRAMTAAPAPWYMRVSGAWANTTYFMDTDAPPK